MSGWFRVTLPFLLVLAGVTLLFSAGMTNAYGSGTQLRANDGVWFPDGAKADTFWDASIIDWPGFSVYAVHCHGQVRADIQLGATGPAHGNPCYSSMGMYSGGGEQSDLYVMLPGGIAWITDPGLTPPGTSSITARRRARRRPIHAGDLHSRIGV